MSEKTRDILDTLLCGFYMAVFCVPTIYLTIGIVKYLNWNGALTFVCPIVCGVFSGTAIVSDSKKKAGLKWLSSVPFSVGAFFVISNTDLLMRIHNAIDPIYYAEHGTPSMGEALSGAAEEGNGKMRLYGRSEDVTLTADALVQDAEVMCT
ncbi:MAG: hypothetical protein IJD85_06085, partial [Oscillospiraceae bacterium]|nr:hypothetical protein [Oscillospiraceae bacterium]